MRIAAIALVAVLWSGVAWGISLEYGVPVRVLGGVSVSVLRVLPGDCFRRFYRESLCLEYGLLIAKMEVDGGEDLYFGGGDVFARFRSGPFWSRIGMGFGFFDRKTAEVRSQWDFNLNVQYGIWFWDVGIFIGWDHWSNGMALADKLGLDFWPEHNDGGNTLLFGVVVKW
ncbi:MAG: hypothetical protein IID17_12520 [Nitrospinae bacterium]|nr:hypothetical protein [Nitrospinota bacterium]